MALFNHATKEVTAKLVYYGPGLCGKTTNLQWIHDNLSFKSKGKLVSLATQTDRTLFFDFLPVELGTIRGMRTRMQIYTVPGQVFYEATRRMVLKGCDAVVFVADSQAAMLDANFESLQSLRRNLLANEIDPSIPMVLQYNKRDLPTALPISVLNARLNPRNAPYFESVAFKGEGVEETLRGITKALFKWLSDYYGGSEREASPAGEAISTPATPPEAAPRAQVKVATPQPSKKPAARPATAKPASGKPAPPARTEPPPETEPPPLTSADEIDVEIPEELPPTIRIRPRRVVIPSGPAAKAKPEPPATPPPETKPTPVVKVAPPPPARMPKPAAEVRPPTPEPKPEPPVAPPPPEPKPVVKVTPPPPARMPKPAAEVRPPTPEPKPEAPVAPPPQPEPEPEVKVAPPPQPEPEPEPPVVPPPPETKPKPVVKVTPPPPARMPKPAAEVRPPTPEPEPEPVVAPPPPEPKPVVKVVPPPQPEPEPEPVAAAPPPTPEPEPSAVPEKFGSALEAARRLSLLPPEEDEPAPTISIQRSPMASPTPPPASEPVFREMGGDPPPRGDDLREDQWLYLLEGAQRGPVDVEDLVDLVLTSIPEDTKVWHPGLEGWVRANRVSEIAVEIPPPLPVPGAVRGDLDEDMPDFDTVPPQFRTALIADEDEAFRKYLAMPLAAQGFTIQEAADGSAAWQLAVQHRPWLILADVSMPEVDGFEFCRRVRSHPLLSHTPLLFISGTDKYKERYRALQIGADDFLTKQLPIREILMRVQLLLTKYSDLGADQAQAGTQEGEAPGVFQGRVEVFGAPALLQMCAQGRLTGIFTALAEDEAQTAAVMGFRDGDVISANVGSTSGLEAAYAFLAWSQGSFKFTPGQPGEGQPLAQSVEHLLLEGCRLLDESQKDGAEGEEGALA